MSRLKTEDFVEITYMYLVLRKKMLEIVILLTIADKGLEQINVESAIPDPKPICANRLAKIDTVIP